MKRTAIILLLFVAVGLPATIIGCRPDPHSPEGLLENVDAKQAIAIANEWKWSQKDIKSRVTSREVVFELSTGKIKRIPLPDDKMLIAVAPYINQTHQ